MKFCSLRKRHDDFNSFFLDYMYGCKYFYSRFPFFDNENTDEFNKNFYDYIDDNIPLSNYGLIMFVYNCWVKDESIFSYKEIRKREHEFRSYLINVGKRHNINFDKKNKKQTTTVSMMLRVLCKELSFFSIKEESFVDVVEEIFNKYHKERKRLLYRVNYFDIKEYSYKEIINLLKEYNSTSNSLFNICVEKVAGVSYEGRYEKIATSLKINGTLKLELDPYNKYDPDAIILYSGKQDIGFISKRINSNIVRNIKSKSAYYSALVNDIIVISENELSYDNFYEIEDLKYSVSIAILSTLSIYKHEK
ncbi:MAG: hypothetical protein PUA56_00840 [Bacillales bacterium]|nr:hypothetical protein [Bacillales bacterium]